MARHSITLHSLFVFRYMHCFLQVGRNAVEALRLATAWRRCDGVNHRASHRMVRFAHYLVAIAGADLFVGPVLAAD